jgi:hypothetical protein
MNTSVYFHESISPSVWLGFSCCRTFFQAQPYRCFQGCQLVEWLEKQGVNEARNTAQALLNKVLIAPPASPPPSGLSCHYPGQDSCNSDHEVIMSTCLWAGAQPHCAQPAYSCFRQQTLAGCVEDQTLP